MKGKNRILTDALREVKNTRSRFFSLFLLSALAVAFLSGLRATAPDMKHSADVYLDDVRMMDLHVLSTLGLTDDDVAALSAREELETVEGAYTVDAMVSLESGDMVVKTLSYREGGLNQPTVQEGRMPQKADECLLDASLLGSSMKIGDTITLNTGDGDFEDALRYDTFTIVGTAISPLYISMDRGSTSLGSGKVGAFLLLREDAYDLDTYTDVYASIRGAAELNAYSDAYDDLLEDTTDALEDLGEERAGLRYDEVVGEANEKLSDARQELSDAEEEVAQELSDAEQELRDARKELDDGWREYRDGQKTLEAEIADARTEIADGEADLLDAAAELEDARVELEDARTSLEDGEAEYEAGWYEYQKGLADYDAGKVDLEAGWKEYEDGLKQYNSGAASLSAGAAQLEQGQQQFDLLCDALRTALAVPPPGGPGISIGSNEELLAALNAITDPETDPLAITVNMVLGGMHAANPSVPERFADLLSTKTQLDSAAAQLSSGGAQLSAAWQQLQEAKQVLDDSQQELDDAFATLQESEQEFSDARKKLDDGWAEYEDGLRKYEEGKADYEQGLLDLEDARQQLADAEAEGRQELQDAYRELVRGEREYADGLQDYEEGKAEAEEKLSDARQELNDAQRKVDEIEDCKWYLLDRNTNAGFVTYGQDAGRMKNLSTVFPLIFFLVAALVCLTTMTRMVEEQRVQIGGLKALGYGKGAIAFKYVGYGFFAGLLGGLVGLIVGRIAIPLIIYTAWLIIYALPGGIHFQSQPLTYVLSVGAAVAVLTLSALAACLTTLTAVPAQLMRPKAPPAGKRVLLEHIKPLWRRLSFNQKVTMRNLFRYKKRFLMTLIGIAGCTALIVTGFGLRDSIFDIMDVQFDELDHYSTTVTVEDDMTDSERQELERALGQGSEVAEYLRCTSVSATAEGPGRSMTVSVMSCGDTGAFARFHTFRDRRSGEGIPFDETSVILPEKTASMLGVGVGDPITLTVDNERYTATVTAIAEHYVMHYVYMSDSMYEQIFGEQPSGNLYLLSMSDGEEETVDRVAQRLVSLSGVVSFSRIESIRDTMQHSMEVVDYAVVIIIVAAAALAFVVLYNLTNINITERLRELATLKVLGFYNKELSAYVYRENVILTILGAVLGLFLGKALLLWLIGTVEIDMAMFGREVKPFSYAVAAVLTCLFSLLVNLVSRRRLKQIDMVESLKTVE